MTTKEIVILLEKTLIKSKEIDNLIDELGVSDLSKVEYMDGVVTKNIKTLLHHFKET